MKHFSLICLVFSAVLTLSVTANAQFRHFYRPYRPLIYAPPVYINPPIYYGPVPPVVVVPPPVYYRRPYYYGRPYFRGYYRGWY